MIISIVLLIIDASRPIAKEPAALLIELCVVGDYPSATRSASLAYVPLAKSEIWSVTHVIA